MTRNPQTYPEREDGDELFASTPPERTASPLSGIITAFLVLIAALALGGSV